MTTIPERIGELIARSLEYLLQAKVTPMYEDYAKKIGGIDLIKQAQDIK